MSFADYLLFDTLLKHRIFAYPAAFFLIFVIVLSIIYQFTDDKQKSVIMAFPIALILTMYIIYLGNKQVKAGAKDAEDREQWYQNYGKSIKVEKSKCMSCLEELQESDKFCSNCGFVNK